MTNATVNMGVKESLWCVDFEYFREIPHSVHIVSLFLVFVRTLHIDSHSSCNNLHTRPQEHAHLSDFGGVRVFSLEIHYID